MTMPSQYLSSVYTTFLNYMGYNKLCTMSTHFANDVKNFGCLDKFSAFPFENYLGCLKRLIRQPTFPLVQVIKRLLEMSNIHTPHIHLPLSFPALRQQHLRGPVISGELYEPCTQYGEVQCRSYCTGVRRSHNCIQVGNKIGIVQNIIRSSFGIYIIHKLFSSYEPLFYYPADSTQLGIYRVSHLGNTLHMNGIDNVRYKCVLFPHKDKYAAIPFLPSFI